MARPASPGGARSALLSTRVTPKLMFGLEMMSRLHRSPIPDIVSRAIKDVFDSDFEGFWDLQATQSEDQTTERRPLLEILWADKPSDRFANIAFFCDRLMSSSDVRLWSYVKTQPQFWMPGVPQTESSLRRDVLATQWEDVQEAHKNFEAAMQMGLAHTSNSAVFPPGATVKSVESSNEFLHFKLKVLSQKEHSAAQASRNGRELQKMMKARGFKGTVHSVSKNAAGNVVAYVKVSRGIDADEYCSSVDDGLEGHIRSEPYSANPT